jgi:hypothetical protein
MTQEAMLTYGCTGLLPNETTVLFSSPPLTSFEPKAIVVPGLKAMEVLDALDTVILDDEAVDLSGRKQGQGFVRCDLPEKVRAWTTGKQIQLSVVSKVKVDEAFQIFVIGVVA